MVNQSKVTFVPLSPDDQCAYAIRLMGRNKSDLQEMASTAGYRSEEIAGQTKAQLATLIAHKAVRVEIEDRECAPSGLLLGERI